VTALATAEAVTSNTKVDEDAEAPSPFASLDRPAIVFVADTGVSMADFEKIQTSVFAQEKIGLAVKAFRMLRMSPEDAEKDPILAEEGKGIPRLIVVNPAKEKVRVFEEKRIKASSLYKEMKRVAGNCYEEKLDKVVKKHFKLLGERDKAGNALKGLQEKETRLAEKGEKAKRKLEELREEMKELEKELEELAKEEREMWKLTSKLEAKPAA